MERLIKYLIVYTSSMFKFILGPLEGFGLGLNPVETILLTIAGMMTSISIVSYFGIHLRTWYFRKFSKGEKKIFSKKNRRIVKIWKQYGVIGVSFLTPLIFSPIIGTLIAVSFGEKKKRIILYMFLFTCLWATFFSLFFHHGGHELLNLISE